MPEDPPSLSAETEEQIAAALVAGRKIAAIRLYRQATGLDLTEAKAYVDQLSEDLCEREPERFAAADNAGCGSAALLLVGVAAVLLLR